MDEQTVSPAQDFSQEEPLLPDETPAAEPETEQSAPARDFAAEAAELLRARPDLVGTELPEAVTQAALTRGDTLLRAFLDHEQTQSRMELERLREENRVYRQNAEAAKRSPVQGVAHSGGDDPEADPFLAGFTGNGW